LDDSFSYLTSHSDTLISDGSIELLLNTDESFGFQHAAILLLARSGTINETKSIVTRADIAALQALGAIENADLARLQQITAANPATIEQTGTGALVVAVLLTAQGHDPQPAMAQARAQMTAIQVKANRYRLDQLTQHAPPELRPAFAALRDTLATANADLSTETEPS
jgi:hypothetical protein